VAEVARAVKAYDVETASVYMGVSMDPCSIVHASVAQKLASNRPTGTTGTLFRSTAGVCHAGDL
jgi:hypothetical protein